jgi:hypothetical protein
MPYKIFAQCPCCRKEAHNLDELEEKFGTRIMDEGNKIPQSYCRKCRGAKCEAGRPCKVKN